MNVQTLFKYVIDPPDRVSGEVWREKKGIKYRREDFMTIDQGYQCNPKVPVIKILRIIKNRSILYNLQQMVSKLAVIIY